jgi:hypothetical protein
MAPDGGANSQAEFWSASEVVTDSNGNAYYLGTVSDGATVDDFGCADIVNPSQSLDDLFLVKLDNQGKCLWQEVIRSDETGLNEVRYNYIARDVTLSPNGNPVIAYTVGLDDPSLADYHTFPVVEEFSQSGNSLWSDVFGNIAKGEPSKFVLEAIGTSNNRLYAAGYTDRLVSFGGSTVRGPLVVAGWDALDSNNQRAEKWIQEFGGRIGNNATPVKDLAVEPETGNAVIVGNYLQNHYHVDGAAADYAKNSNMFFQVIDESGVGVRGWASSATGPSYDTEVATAVDIAADNTVYIAGWFKGELDSQLELGPNVGGYLPAIPTQSDNQDYFILKYDDTGELPNKSVHGDLVDAHISRMYYTSTSNRIKTESIRDIEIGSSWIAFTGGACNPTVECVNDDAYLELHQRGTLPSSSQGYSFLTRTHTSSEYLIGRNVALTDGSNRVWWNGANGDTNYSYLGGSQLPGSDYFLATYNVSP